jgi:hypothetical protein
MPPISDMECHFSVFIVGALQRSKRADAEAWFVIDNRTTAAAIEQSATELRMSLKPRVRDEVAMTCAPTA